MCLINLDLLISLALDQLAWLYASEVSKAFAKIKPSDPMTKCHFNGQMPPGSERVQMVQGDSRRSGIASNDSNGPNGFNCSRLILHMLGIFVDKFCVSSFSFLAETRLHLPGQGPSIQPPYIGSGTFSEGSSQRFT